MVARLRQKAGSERLAVTLGDFADLPVATSYRLTSIVFNSLFNLLTQDEQVRCFVNVAERLDRDGVFVVEAVVTAFLYRLHHNQYVDGEAITVDEVRRGVARRDPVARLLVERHVRLSAQGVRVAPIVTCYAWRSELDLLARIAGLPRKERRGSWSGEPFGAESELHVSVYSQ